ncbi:D-inositol-3-phosphate glycosyltransferase [mine drainage metagenome]|uniref:D-inositol-3-phosphate glycosyltransferase n=1 Tax=mine drainage metagenome TaxID=410659 RepID=A0A1J5TB63_9ZZZZ
MILFDLTHTSHTRARTGIQRVARTLLREVAKLGPVEPVTWDPHGTEWRPLELWERANLEAREPGSKRGAKWPARAKWRGRWRGWRRGGGLSVAGALCGAASGGNDGGAGLLVPEFFGAATARAYPALFRAVPGPKVALFHDAIALQHPEISPPRTVARTPAYLVELARFDGVAAVSEDSRQTLLDYWAWTGIGGTPPVVAVPNGIRPPGAASGAPRPQGPPRILCVGTLEGRKNHLALLEACESLWSRGADFSLRLVGAVQAETGAAARDRALALAAAGRPLRLDISLSDEEVDQAYRDCDFTVYPSIAEGFGLPVLESVAHGRPCICSARGALGEAARGGGCLALAETAPAALAGAIARLVDSPAEVARLSAEAAARPVRTFADQARDLTAFLASLRGLRQA